MYAKAWVQFLAAVLAAGIPAITGQHLGWSEWLNFGTLVLGAVSVYNATNLPGYNYAKAVASALSGCAVVLISVLTDGISVAEWVQVGVAFIVGVGGVIAVRNRGTVNGVFRSGPHVVSYGGALQ